MRESIENTAVLIFSRSARAEARQKQLLNSKDLYTHRNLYSDLIDHTKEIVRKSGLPYLLIDEQNQKGKEFGQKLSNAFRHVFNSGFRKVIAIGNDCPQLTPERLIYAAAQLEQNKIVLGPAKDGGDYLIGLHRDSFIVDLFTQLPWQSHDLHHAFKSKCEQLGIDVFELDTLSDVDNEADVYEQLYLCPQLFKRLFSSLFLINDRTEDLIVNQPSEFIVLQIPSRAPPL